MKNNPKDSPINRNIKLHNISVSLTREKVSATYGSGSRKLSTGAEQSVLQVVPLQHHGLNGRWVICIHFYLLARRQQSLLKCVLL